MESQPVVLFPPHCPNEACEAHSDPSEGFCHKIGFYKPKHRAHPVQRYLCKHCGRSFSRQTFRLDYCDNKPWQNVRVFDMVSSGVGYRQIARKIGMTPKNVEMKTRKIARHLGQLHLRLMGQFESGRTFAFDELETFEQCRSTKPLTVPISIDQETAFIVDACSDTIPPSGKMTPKRRRLIAAEREKSGRRENRSRKACRRVLSTLSEHVPAGSEIAFRTDKKRTYPGLIKEAFGAGVPHTQIHSRRRRDPTNPLHRINLTLARARDLMGRLRRRSWLVTKRREFLDVHLLAFACYRNYAESRFNADKESPAQMLGFLPRKLTAWELLSWRQDLGEWSIHPLARMDVYRS